VFVRSGNIIESACWRALACSEAPASLCASAASYGFSKDVGVLAIVEPELELCEVERQILLADVMVGSDHAALEQAPEVFQVISVNFAAYIFTLTMCHKFVLIALSVQVAIPFVFIGRDQINLIAHGLADESVQGSSVCIFDDLANHVALAANRADYTDLPGMGRAAPAVLLTLFPVSIFLFAAKKRLVNLDDPHQLLELRVFHCGAQPMAHVPSRLVRPAPDLALNLESANALLGIEHLPEHFKPDLQREFGVLTDRPASDAEAIVFARLAEPMKRPRVQLVDRGIAAFRTAYNAVPPTVFHQELFAGFVRRKSRHQFSGVIMSHSLANIRQRVNRVIIAKGKGSNVYA
jgi:hypothetical protein